MLLKCMCQNYSFSSGFLSTILLSFLSYSVFLAIVVKCAGSAYVDVVLK